MRALKAFALGLVAFGALAYAAAATVAFLAVGGDLGALRVGVGPLLLVEIERGVAGSSATTFGPGLLAVAVLGGVVNASAAAALGRRRRP